MLARLIGTSLLRRRGRRLVAVLAIAVGSGASATLLGVLSGVGDALARDFAALGAKIEVVRAEQSINAATPAGTIPILAPDLTIDERELSRFGSPEMEWRNQITAFAPLVESRATVDGRPVEVVGSWFNETSPRWSTAMAGLDHVQKSWEIRGRWPADPGEALVGRATGMDLGRSFEVRGPAAGLRLRVVGVLSSGTEDDARIFVPLAVAQDLAGKRGRIDRILVSAVTTPDASLLRGPASPMAADDLCVSSARAIARDIDKVMKGVSSRLLRGVNEMEAAVFGRVQTVAVVMALACVLASVLGLVAVMSALVVERRREFAVLKAIGAERSRVAALVVGEAMVLGFVGGALGAGVAVVLSGPLSEAVFGFAQPPVGAVLLSAWLAAIVIPAAGVVLPLRRALSVEPAFLLREV